VVATAPSDTAGGFRPDIQGLRAIAVLLVLVYHLWPGALPGGYVGVDVFFVISGYLITSLLVKDLEARGSISFSTFYVRRARRLLPASLTTLVVILVAAYLFLPAFEWRGTAREVAASALYVENWQLAARSVDYLAADAEPSLTQHFWSLTGEEQV
jgi:peptidoglycan/LPS O-acetylase OafA/YrhL